MHPRGASERVSMETKPANATYAYRAAHVRLDENLNRINRLVLEHVEAQSRQPENWGFVGDMNHLVACLNDALEFLGATKEKTT